MSMTLKEAKHLLSNAMKVKRELEEENAELRWVYTTMSNCSFCEDSCDTYYGIYEPACVKGMREFMERRDLPKSVADIIEGRISELEKELL